MLEKYSGIFIYIILIHSGCIIGNMHNDTKMSRLSVVSIIIIASLVLGLVSGLLTDKYVLRSDDYFTNRCRSIQRDSNSKINCNKVYIGSRGWPFPSTSLYSDGSEKEIIAKQTYCFGCGEESRLGSQLIYNGLILAIVYVLVISLIYQVVKRIRKT